MKWMKFLMSMIIVSKSFWFVFYLSMCTHRMMMMLLSPLSVSITLVILCTTTALNSFIYYFSVLEKN